MNASGRRGEKMDARMREKFRLTFSLVQGLRAYELERIKRVIDRQYAEKATKLALDDLSEESLKKWFEMEEW